MIGEIDAGVGSILDTLRELGIAEKTLVVFTSDNGPWLIFDTHGGSAGLLRDGKGTTYEGGMRVPAIFWQPGTVKPGTVMEIGATMDLLPTFCAMAGVTAPDDRKLDGHDLTGVLIGKSGKSSREEMYYWRQSKLYAVRSGPWKAHFINESSYGRGEKRKVSETPELYHLDHDPGEQYNIAARHPGVIARLTALAREHEAGIEPAEDQMNKRIAGTQ